MAHPSENGEAEGTVEEFAEGLFATDAAEDGGIGVTEGTVGDDGGCGMLGGAESVVDAFVGDAVGKAAGVADEKDVGMEGIVEG